MADTQRSKRRRVLACLAAAALTAYALGFFVFVDRLPGVSARTVHADAVVALTGGMERLDAAVALFEKGVGKRLLISGVHPFITKERLKRLVRGGPRFDCCADLGFEATNTHGNAAEAAAWTRSHGYRSVVLVTADYHMPRSLTEFSMEMPGVTLVPYPVAARDVTIGSWWRDPHALRILQLEYVKYLGSVALTALVYARAQGGLDATVDGGKARPAY